MKHVGLVAFGVTTLVLVPAAIHHLSAGSEQVAKLLAPGLRTIHVAGAKIDVATDQTIVTEGETVTLSLRATAVKAHTVKLDVLVYEAAGTQGSRTEQPAKRLATEHVTLEATPDGTTKQLSFRLPGNHDQYESFGRYTFFVMSPKAAYALSHAKGRTDPNDPIGPYDWFDRIGWGERAFAKGTAARIDVNTRNKRSPIAMTVPQRVKVGEPFDVKLRITNPLDSALQQITVDLRVPSGSGLYGDYVGIDGEHISIERSEVQVDLAPHQTKEITTRVTARRPGVLGLYASTQRCYTCAGASDVSELGDGLLEAIDVIAQTP